MPNPNGNAASLKPFQPGALWPSSHRLAIRQGSEMQGFAYEAAKEVSQASGEGLDVARARAQAIAAVARAWTDCRQQVRIEQGKPNPGQLKPTAERKPRRQASHRPVVLPKVSSQPTTTPQPDPTKP